MDALFESLFIVGTLVEGLIDVTKELADVLAYVLELENKIDELQIKIAQNEIITVELIGEKF